jgi:hypothetical protein
MSSSRMREPRIHARFYRDKYSSVVSSLKCLTGMRLITLFTRGAASEITASLPPHPYPRRGGFRGVSPRRERE